MYLCKCLMGIAIKDESDWKGILLDWVTAACELWMFLVQGAKQTPLNLKRNAVFLKQRGHSVTSTSEECINTELDLSIYDSVRLLGPVVNLSLTMKSLRTLTSAFTICVMHHHCFFCQALNCYKMGMNVNRHLWSDYSLMHVNLPSGQRALHYIYVK